MDQILTGSLSPADLLRFSKALDPLSEQAREEIRTIQSLARLDEYSEQDVREDIITPLLRVLGYRKETIFSVDREKTLRIAGKRLAVDYSVTLWEENFWIIEAKKPAVTKGVFGYDVLWQAVQYAIHPDINAALVVLCDGHALEVYDREQSLEEPILRVERQHLLRDIDQIRTLLGPMQAWFFEKRRIVRLLDKVFDREFNLGRAEDLGNLVRHRLEAKRQKIIDNMRALPRPDTPEKTKELFQATETPELVEVHFWVEASWTTMMTVAQTLVERSRTDAFNIIHRIFPDRPRPANHAFHINALLYLIVLEESGATVSWLPDWLQPESPASGLAGAIRRLIGLGLTNFAGDRDRQIVLLHAAAARRLSKLMFVLLPELRSRGELLHVLQRHLGDEFAFGQLVSSPTRHLIFETERAERIVNSNFVAQMNEGRTGFRSASAREELKRAWQTELRLLNSVDDYGSLLRERDLGEVYPTEQASVRYDQLGHGALCMLDEFPAWKAYVLETHRPAVEMLAKLGSWKARDWIGMRRDEPVEVSNETYAQRFFLNDEEISKQLARRYSRY